MSQTWTDYKEQAIKDYLDGVSVSQLAKKYSSAMPNIIANLQRAGVYQYVSNRWTNDEIAYLKENYASADWDVLQKRLSRFTKQRIIKKASDLGLKRECYYWTNNDIVTLQKAYENHVPDNQLEALFDGRFTLTAILTKAYKLHLKRRVPWTHEDEQLMLDVYEDTPTECLVGLFPGHTVQQIQQKARTLGLHSYRYLQRAWTQADDDFICEHWKTMSDGELADHLHRGFSALKMRRQILGLVREVPAGAYEYLRSYLQPFTRSWRKESIRACGYKCIATGGQFDDVHHLYASNLILRDTLTTLNMEYGKWETYTPEQLDAIAKKYVELHQLHPLGVCLSHDVHMQFHHEYGFGDNTPDQFYEFMHIHYPTVHIPVTINAA